MAVACYCRTLICARHPLFIYLRQAGRFGGGAPPDDDDLPPFMRDLSPPASPAAVIPGAGLGGDMAGEEPTPGDGTGDFFSGMPPPADDLGGGVGALEDSDGGGGGADSDDGTGGPPPAAASPTRDAEGGMGAGFAEAQTGQQRNQELLLALDGKNRELAQLHAELDAARAGVDLHAAEALGADADHRDAKILSMAKKNRGLTVALQRAKAKATAVEAKLGESVQRVAKLERALGDRKAEQAAALRRAEQRRREGGGATTPPPKPPRPGATTKKAMKKVDELRYKLDAERVSAKKLRRALLREVGEGADLDKIVDETKGKGGWRGRAQQIVKLKAKCRTLSEELRRQVETGGKGRIENAKVRAQLARDRQRPSVDARAQAEIAEMEAERKESLDRVFADYEDMERKAGEARRRADAARARVSVLQKDNRRLRDQIKVVLDKTATDDSLIDQLRNDIQAGRRRMAEMQQRVEAVRRGAVGQDQHNRLKQLTATQAAQIERQEQLLTSLRAELQQAQEASSRDIVDRAREELDAQGQEVNLKLLKVENERLTDLVNLVKRKLAASEKDRNDTLRRAKDMERSIVELERRLGNINHAGRKR